MKTSTTKSKKVSQWSVKELQRLAAAFAIFTINGKTYRGTICAVYKDKIEITSGTHVFFPLKSVCYGLSTNPSENCVHVPTRVRGYLSKIDSEIMESLPRFAN